MTNLDEIASDPNNDAAATGASKATIFVFIATFGYLVFFSGASPGLVGGAAFFVVGTFVVSIVISMPLFLLRAKLPRLGPLISIADIAVTILLTRFVYLWLFAAEPVLAGEPFVVQCQQPLPEFTLGADSNPSEPQVEELCACIWSRLEGWEKETSRAISQGREGEVSALYLRAFSTRFGSALEHCGGMNL